jgi:hypothetical protein
MAGSHGIMGYLNDIFLEIRNAATTFLALIRLDAGALQ